MIRKPRCITCIYFGNFGECDRPKCSNFPAPKPVTLSEHMSRAAKARWAKKTPEERSEYARMMVREREAKRGSGAHRPSAG